MIIVSKSTRDAVAASYTGNALYSGEALQRMAEENPEVADFIAQFTQATGGSQDVSEGAILVYELIRNQLEADEFKFPS